jgi:hypothetical protein
MNYSVIEKMILRSVLSISILIFCGAACSVMGKTNGSKGNAFNVDAVGELEPSGDPRLVGQWRTDDDKFAIVFLADGRIASFDNRTNGALSARVEIGTYRVDGDLLKYSWMLSGPDEDRISVNGDGMIASSTNSSLSTRLHRRAGPERAAGDYDQIYRAVRKLAEESFADVPVGAVKSMPMPVAEMIPDRHPDQIFSNATVYREATRFQWILTPIRQYETHSSSETGFTCSSYTFLPNGRFSYDGWLYDVLVDDNKPFDERSRAQRQGREVNARHQQHWGRYRVIAGHDALEPDTVEMVNDDGSRQTFQVVAGRRYMATANPRLLFNNYDEVRKEKQLRAGR